MNEIDILIDTNVVLQKLKKLTQLLLIYKKE